jgi:hypothetical protein
MFSYQFIFICFFFVFFLVKYKLCPGFEKTGGLLALFMLISARFEFELVIYCNFFLFFGFYLFIDGDLW